MLGPDGADLQLAPFRARLTDRLGLEGSDPEAAEAWFRLSTARINQLAAAQQRLAAQMNAAAERIQNRALWSFVALGTALIVLLLALAVISFFIARRLLWHVQAEQRDAERIRFLGRHDPTTGLPNRGYFEELLEPERRDCLTQGRMLALLLLDVLDFKEINRTWGIAAGDAAMLAAARRLKPLLDVQHHLARLASDQFALMQAPINDRAETALLAQKIIRAFEEPVLLDEQEIKLDVRIGITLFPPDADTYELLLRNADLALHHGDSEQKTGYRFYVSEMYQQYLDARMLARELRRTDVEREFALHYQPKVDASDQRLVGAEALIRWNHPTRGLLRPKDFIGEAERDGSIVKIGRWAIREACRQAAAWKRAGLDVPVLSVNLSAVELRKAGLVEAIADALAVTKLDPDGLEVEVTESLLIADLEDTLQVLRRIRELGLGLAIDDFGTGYSSLSYLHRFPATALKLDRSFVMSLEVSEQGRRIVEAVISLARRLSLRVIAEGVESQSQLGILRELGCDEFQGYLLAPPLTAEQFEERLRRD